MVSRKIIGAILCIVSLQAMENNNNDEHKKVCEYIVENKQNPEVLAHLLIDMARWESPDLKAAKKIFKLGVSADVRDEGDIFAMPAFLSRAGSTALTAAAYYGNTDYIELLLDHDADIEIKSPWDGRTALMAASLQGHNETLKLLIARGANVNAKNCCGTTGLIWASDYGHLETVKILVQAGADVDCKKDGYGDTALSCAQDNLKKYHDAQHHWLKRNDSAKADYCQQKAEKCKEIIAVLKHEN